MQSLWKILRMPNPFPDGHGRIPDALLKTTKAKSFLRLSHGTTELNPAP